MAAYEGHTAIVRALLEAGADVAAVDPSMKATALHAASYAGRTEAARVLIEHGIDIDKQGPRNGYTALHDAIWQNNIETAKVPHRGRGQSPPLLARWANAAAVCQVEPAARDCRPDRAPAGARLSAKSARSAVPPW